MEKERPFLEGWRRILLPSLVAAFLPFVLLWLPPARWHSGLVVAAAVLTLVIAVIGVRAPWERLPGWAPCVLAFAYLLVIALLRTAGGPSGVAPMVLLPVFWLALSGTRRQLWCLLIGVTAVFVLPLISWAARTIPPAPGGPGFSSSSCRESWG